MPDETRILIPWDFSRHSRVALQHALENYPASDLTILCVLEPPNPYAPGFDWGPEAEQKSAQRCAEEFRHVVEHEAIDSLRFVVKFGDPANEISRFAESSGASTIVISTHGRTGLNRLMMGSVAQRVMLSATCPVLLLPPKWFEAHHPEPA